MAGLLLFDPQYSNLWLFNKENHDSPDYRWSQDDLGVPGPKFRQAHISPLLRGPNRAKWASSPFRFIQQMSNNYQPTAALRSILRLHGLPKISVTPSCSCAANKAWMQPKCLPRFYSTLFGMLRSCFRHASIIFDTASMSEHTNDINCQVRALSRGLTRMTSPSTQSMLRQDWYAVVSCLKLFYPLRWRGNGLRFALFYARRKRLSVTESQPQKFQHQLQ